MVSRGRREIIHMPTKMCALAACLILAGVCAAKEHDYQKGTLLRMDSTSCGMQEKGSKSLTGELLGTDAQSKKTQEVLCQEYVLQTNRVVYQKSASFVFVRRVRSFSFERKISSGRSRVLICAAIAPS